MTDVNALCIGGPADRRWWAQPTCRSWQVAIPEKVSLDDINPTETPMPYRTETYNYKEFSTGEVPGPNRVEFWDHKAGEYKTAYYWQLWVHESVDLDEFEAQAKFILLICRLVKP